MRIAEVNCSIPVMALMVATVAALGAPKASGQYQGVSKPPADDVITTSTIQEAKPPAGKPMAAEPAPLPTTVPPPEYIAPAAPAQPMAAGQPMESAAPVRTAGMEDGTDDGIVHVAPGGQAAPPMLNERTRIYDARADADIVHVQPMRAGELSEGTAIRVKLLDRLSTAQTEKGEPFRTRVATDVMAGGMVVIPAGTEIDGHVADVSMGHVGGRGTMRLEPESLTLPNGTRYRLHAALSSAPGSHTRVVGESTVRPDSRLKRDGIEYGSAIGAGAGMGAIVGGPVGALTGSLIGAGAITVHLMVSHPQATLDSGTTLMFMLTDPLYLGPPAMSGN